MGRVRIKYADIIRSTGEILEARFSKPVYDVIQDFPRACFMTKLHVAETDIIMSNHVRDRMTLTIYYFPSDEYNHTAENLIMQDDLKELLLVELDGLLPVKDNFSLEIMGYTGAVVDGVLHTKIDISMNHKIVRDEYAELMEKLEIKYEKHE